MVRCKCIHRFVRVDIFYRRHLWLTPSFLCQDCSSSDLEQMYKSLLVWNLLAGIHWQCSLRIASEAQMIDALTDIHLLESAVKLNLIEGLKNDSLNIRDYYEALFDSKPYSYKEFQESFTYFTRRPSQMEVFLDSVLLRVQMMELEN